MPLVISCPDCGSDMDCELSITSAIEGVILSVVLELRIGWKIANSKAASPSDRSAMSIFFRSGVVLGTVFWYDHTASNTLASKIPA